MKINFNQTKTYDALIFRLKIKTFIRKINHFQQEINFIIETKSPSYLFLYVLMQKKKKKKKLLANSNTIAMLINHNANVKQC